MNLKKSFQAIPKMTEILDIENRKPVWIALSELYLDTELQKYTHRWMAQIFLNSPYSWEEIMRINKYEVFPVLIHNMLSPAGQWMGFNEEWMIEAIQNSLKNKSIFRKLETQLGYRIQYWMLKGDVEKLKSHYELLRNQREAE